MGIYPILPDSASRPIDKKSIDRIRELCRENHNTPEYESEREERYYENMFEISEFLHILRISLTRIICKNLDYLLSFVKKSLERSFLVSLLSSSYL